MRSSLFCLLCLMACGRSELVEGEFPDASVVMPAPPPPVVKDPLYVFERGRCIDSTNKDALKPSTEERVLAVEFTAQEECSGAGGDWFIGKELGGVREVAFGGHTCLFLPDAWRGSQTRRFGVVRFNLRAVSTRVPEGWCLVTLTGSQSVKTDVNVEAFGVYETEADAKAAAQALR